MNNNQKDDLPEYSFKKYIEETVNLINFIGRYAGVAKDYVSKVPREILIGAVIFGLALGGAYIGTKLASQKKSEWSIAIEKNMVALYDFDKNGTQELVYFPVSESKNENKAPPLIFAKAGDEYTIDNEFSKQLYVGTLALGGILSSDCETKAKLAQIAQLERETLPALHSFFFRALMLEPSLAISFDGKLFSASVTEPIIDGYYPIGKIINHLRNGDGTSAGLLAVSTALLGTGTFTYTDTPCYFKLMDSIPYFHGTCQEKNNMVDVTPGTSIRYGSSQWKDFQDFRRDKGKNNIVYNPAFGYICNEPSGTKSETKWIAGTHEQQRQFKTGSRNTISSSQQIYQSFDAGMQQANKQAQQWSQQTNQQIHQLNQQFGNAAQDIRKGINEAINNWNTAWKNAENQKKK